MRKRQRCESVAERQAGGLASKNAALPACLPELHLAPLLPMPTACVITPPQAASLTQFSNQQLGALRQLLTFYKVRGVEGFLGLTVFRQRIACQWG
jgi:hypothetical protein